MQSVDYLDIISPHVIRLQGHRIGLEHIIERYHRIAAHDAQHPQPLVVELRQRLAAQRQETAS